MKRSLASFLIAAAYAAAPALAAPIFADSHLEMSHSFVINNGQSPTGITINNLSNTYFVNTNAESDVDSPLAAETVTGNFIVGNPFSDPPLAVQGERDSTSALPGGFEGARARLDYSVLTEDDPDDGEFDITRREIEQFGSAVALITSDPIAASAMSSHVSGRNYRFDNTTNELISFNISGLFNASLWANYNGDDGFARTSGGFEMLFETGPGSSVTHFPIAPYLVTTEDSAPGATVSEQLLLNSGGITGVHFGASATAIGDGTDTLARVDAENRYIFGISLDAGASLTLSTSYRQSNAVEYTPRPDVPPVPLPAPALLLIAALTSFAGFRGLGA